MYRDSRKGRAQSHQGTAVLLFTDGLTKWQEMTTDGVRQDTERGASNKTTFQLCVVILSSQRRSPQQGRVPIVPNSGFENEAVGSFGKGRH